MKQIKFMFLALLLSIAGNTFAQFDEQVLSGEEIVENYLQVSGLKNVDFSKPIYLETTTEMMGQDIKMIIITHGEDKFRMTMSPLGQLVIIVSDGTQGWAFNPIKNESKDITKEELKDIQKQTNVKSTLSYYSNTDYLFEADGTVMEQGQELYKVNFIPLDKNSGVKNMSVYFNTVTGLIDHISSTAEGQRIIIKMSNYADFSGLKLPSEKVFEALGQRITSKLDKIELDYKIDETTFAKPSAIVIQ